MSIEFILHGSGTSSSIPNIPCLTATKSPICPTCWSTKLPSGRRNHRRNTGALLRIRRPKTNTSANDSSTPSDDEDKDAVVVIDAGKTFLASAQEWFPHYGLRCIAAVVLTHAHADAMNGLDDLRGWTLRGQIQDTIHVYLSEDTFTELKRAFPYLISVEFATGGGDVPAFTYHIIEDGVTFTIAGGITFTPIAVEHGRFFPAALKQTSSTTTKPETLPTATLPTSGGTPTTSQPETPPQIVPYMAFGFAIDANLPTVATSSIPKETAPTRILYFSPTNTTQLLSCSDDFTVKLWDIPSQTSITTFTDHSDYVRSGHILPSNPSLILSGSYDSTMRLFDARTGTCTMTMSCAPSVSSGLTRAGEQVPIFDVLPFPSGTMAISASGSAGIVRIWDLVAGGRCVRAMSNHQKSVTCLAFDGSASRLLTGGLDHMVKVYDVSTYKVVHTMRYPAPVLCLAVSPDDTHIGAGMADGTFSIRRRQPKASEMPSTTKSPGLPSLFEGTTPVRRALTTAKPKSKPVGDVDELRVESKRKKRLKEYDRLLKSFKYSAALDSVLKKSIPPTTSFALIMELVHQDALRVALSGRDDILLEPVIQLLVKYIADPRFGELACDVSMVVLDMYGSVIGQSPLIDSLLMQLRKKVQQELRYQRELASMRGALEMLLTTSTLGPATSVGPVAARANVRA